MTFSRTIVFVSIVVLGASTATGRAESDIIAQLSASIAAAESETEKSRLHMYRARNYRNSGNMEMAEQDYDAALAYDHKGWIHLERSRFYLIQGDFLQSRKEAVAAAKETPTLEGDAQKLIAEADKRLKRETVEDHPRVIHLDKRWKTRYARKNQGQRSAEVRAAYAARNKARAARRPRVSST